MAFCSKCGTKINEGEKFCSSCGTAVEQNFQAQQNQDFGQATPNQSKNDFAAKISEFNNTTDTTNEFLADDISKNKGMAILSYFGPLVLIPILASKSKFVKYHANQGLLVFLAEVAYQIIRSILMQILYVIFPLNYLGGRGVIFSILSFVISLVWIAIAVLAIIGIINAASGKAKELPIIGKIKLLK